MNYYILGPVIIAIMINIIVPNIVKKFATEKQITPPEGAHKLSYFDQLIHMFVHHAQVPLTSSVIIAVIVSVSIYFYNLIKSN